jgi:membrane protein
VPIIDRLQNRLWAWQPQAMATRCARIAAIYLLALLRDVAEGELSLRAMSLVYTSLLSLVPLLALAFSVLKAFGFHNSLEPLLATFLAPLGAQGTGLARTIVEFVGNMRVGVLGSVGVAMLLYTAVATIHKVEASFNFLWHIPRARGLKQRFGEYLSILIAGPVLVVAALGAGTALVGGNPQQPAAVHNWAVGAVEHLLPYLLIVGGFTFLYAYIPNARVSMRAAVIGGVTGGVAWKAASFVFATFAAGVTNYNAIYSGFAIVIFLLIWLYVSWQILLLGCRLAFFVDHPQRLLARAEALPGSRELEWLALRVAAEVTQRFVRAQATPTRAELHRLIGASSERLDEAVDMLIAAGVLAESIDRGALLPARDPATLSVAELWQRARGATPAATEADILDAQVSAVLGQLEAQACAAAPGSLRDWATSTELPAPQQLQAQAPESAPERAPDQMPGQAQTPASGRALPAAAPLALSSRGRVG